MMDKKIWGVASALWMAACAGVNADPIDVSTVWDTVFIRPATTDYSVKTYQTNANGLFGFGSPLTDVVTGSSLQATGITLVDAGVSSNHLQFHNVPTTISPDYYIEFSLAPKSGYQFTPEAFSVKALHAGPNRWGSYDLNMDFMISTSLDNFATMYGGATWGRNNRFQYADKTLDLSAIGPITGETLFRLYLSDSDGVVSALASTATWPYGLRFHGVADVYSGGSAAAIDVPEPAAPAILSLGLAGFGFFRIVRRSVARAG